MMSGIDCLDDAALLQALTEGRPSARRVGEALGEPLSLEALMVDDLQELSSRYHLSQARARRLWLAGECHRRLVRRRSEPRPYLRDADAVYTLMAPRLAGLEVETFWALALDLRGRLIGEPIQLSQGDIDGTEAGPRSFMRAVLRRGAAGAVAVHNHPTGDPSPSAGDLAVTRKLCAAGKTVDVPVVDHVVIGQGAWVSLRNEHTGCFV